MEETVEISKEDMSKVASMFVVSTLMASGNHELLTKENIAAIKENILKDLNNGYIDKYTKGFDEISQLGDMDEID